MIRQPRVTPTHCLLAALLVAALAPACPAIEMFTNFGDGSRIGLPSLEVPIEAYPGILRSDRIRARRRAMRARPQAAVPGMQPQGMPKGMTIRAMPEAEAVPSVPGAPITP